MSRGAWQFSLFLQQIISHRPRVLCGILGRQRFGERWYWPDHHAERALAMKWLPSAP
jgi:hypothetical protein